MSPPGPPPPPEIPPHRPARGREEVAVGRAKGPSEQSSLQALLKATLEELHALSEAQKERHERSDVRHHDTESLRAEIAAWNKAFGEEQRRRASRKKLAQRIGGAIGVVVALVVGIWQGYSAMHPKPPPVQNEDVQQTVEQRTTVLEEVVSDNTSRVIKLEEGFEESRRQQRKDTENVRLQILEGIGYLGAKIDAGGRARTVEAPEAVTEAQQTLAEQRKRDADRRQREKLQRILEGKEADRP